MKSDKLIGILLMLVSVGLIYVVAIMGGYLVHGSGWLAAPIPLLWVWAILATVGMGVAAAIIGTVGVIAYKIAMQD